MFCGAGRVHHDTRSKLYFCYKSRNISNFHVNQPVPFPWNKVEKPNQIIVAKKAIVSEKTLSFCFHMMGVTLHQNDTPSNVEELLKKSGAGEQLRKNAASISDECLSNKKSRLAFQYTYPYRRD
jgi:hypothetical protein